MLYRIKENIKNISEYFRLIQSLKEDSLDGLNLVDDYGYEYFSAERMESVKLALRNPTIVEETATLVISDLQEKIKSNIKNISLTIVDMDTKLILESEELKGSFKAIVENSKIAEKLSFINTFEGEHQIAFFMILKRNLLNSERYRGFCNIDNALKYDAKNIMIFDLEAELNIVNLKRVIYDIDKINEVFNIREKPNELMEEIFFAGKDSVSKIQQSSGLMPYVETDNVETAIEDEDIETAEAFQCENKRDISLTTIDVLLKQLSENKSIATGDIFLGLDNPLLLLSNFLKTIKTDMELMFNATKTDEIANYNLRLEKVMMYTEWISFDLLSSGESLNSSLNYRVREYKSFFSLIEQSLNEYKKI